MNNIDYQAIAKEYGGVYEPAPSRQPKTETAPIDYAAIAKEYGGVYEAKEEAKPEAETTAAGLAGAVTRGLALPAAGALAGAAIGAPVGGVGAAPGAAAGFAAGALTQALGDPVTQVINNMLGTQFTLPSEAMSAYLTSLGIAAPDTPTERIVQAGAEAAGGAGGLAQAAKIVQKVARGPVTKAVAGALGEQQALQVAAGGASGLAAQKAAEEGYGTTGQILAGLGAGGVVGLAPSFLIKTVSRRPPATALAQEPETPTASGAITPETLANQQPQTATTIAQAAEPPPTVVTQTDSPLFSELQQTASNPSEILSLASRASGNGFGSSAARARLADLAQINLDAKKAADELGIDLPPDVFSDNPEVRSAIGLTRSKVGSEAEAAWERTVRDALLKADDITQKYDAQFIEGRPSTGIVSQRILDRMTSERDAIRRQAEDLYERVSAAVPKSTPVDLAKTREYFEQLAIDLGPKGRMTTQEKNLNELIKEEGATYFALQREKELIGRALGGKDSPYGDSSTAVLKKLYGALAQDQIDNVAIVAGPDTKRQLRTANLLVSKQKALEKRIVGAFGREIDGSVATKMRTAITTAAQGDAKAFNQLLKIVPNDLKKQTLATALATVSQGRGVGRAAGVEDVVFSPAQYVKIYRGLRANPSVYSEMVKVMGKDWDKTARSLYEVSRRISDASSRVLTTGKANQALGEMAAEGIIGKVMQNAMAQRIAAGLTGNIPVVGSFVAPDVINFMNNTKSAAVKRASDLFLDPNFQKMTVEAAERGRSSDSTVRSVAVSKAFAAFAKVAKLPQGLDQRILWLQAATQAAVPQMQPETK